MKSTLMKTAGLVLILFLNGCMYQSTDYYYNTVVPGEEPTLTFTTSLDTLSSAVNDSFLIAFTANVDYGRILQVDFYYMDTALVYRSDTTTDTFWLNPFIGDTAYSDSLEVNVYYSTNTGSLADVLGGEYYYYIHSWYIQANLEEIK